MVNNPNIRFAGFADEWEERKLGDFLSIPKKIRADVNESRDLMTLKLNLGGLEIGANRETLELGTTIYYERKAGQFIYGKQNFFNGSMAIIPPELDGKATSGDVPSLDISGINPNYLYTYVSRRDYWKRKEAAASGTGSKRIHEATLFGFDISEPGLKEQQKIGSLFSTLDHKIGLEERQISLLKDLKKGFLQKMFPKQGAKVPEWRFAGFTDDWEERKLKDVVEKQIKGKAQFEKLEQGDVEYLDASRLNGGKAILTNGIKDVTLDDILILWDGSNAGTVYHGFEGALGSTLKAYRTSTDSKFVYQYLKRCQDNIYNNYRTPNIPHVQKDFLDVFTISVPGSDEQQKIGSFFKQLDDTIALHQRKLDLLKDLKKGLSQQMFV